MSNKVVTGAPAVFVKGGTTTGPWDKAKRNQYEQSDQRRAYQDGTRRTVARAAAVPNEQAAIASRELGSSANPQVVLKYKAKDSALDQDAICQIISQPLPDNPKEVGLILILVCPKCLDRHGRMDDSQVMVKSWNRHFDLDTSRARVWMDPESGRTVRIAGTVTLKDICSCDALGCDWKFRIDNSVLYGTNHYTL